MNLLPHDLAQHHVVAAQSVLQRPTLPGNIGASLHSVHVAQAIAASMQRVQIVPTPTSAHLMFPHL